MKKEALVHLWQVSALLSVLTLIVLAGNVLVNPTIVFSLLAHFQQNPLPNAFPKFFFVNFRRGCPQGIP